MLGFAAVPPLLVLCLDELFVRQRWRPWVTGLAIGVLALVQLSVGPRCWSDPGGRVIASSSWSSGESPTGRVGRPRPLCTACRRRGRRDLGRAAGLPGLVRAGRSGPPVGRRVGEREPAQLRGEHPRALRPPDAAVGPHHRADPPAGRVPGATLSDQYLGWGLVGVLSVGLVLWWRDLRLWLFGTVAVLAAFLSLGLSMHGWTLWRLLVRAPADGQTSSRAGSDWSSTCAPP